MRNLISKRLEIPSIGFKVGRSEKLRRSPRKKYHENTQHAVKEEKVRKLFSGYKFFLDVHTESKSTEIRNQILSLGGEVEEFLSKDIKVVITNQITDKVDSKKLVGNSPISNGPSPIQVFSSKRAFLQIASPFSSHSPQLSIDAMKMKNTNTTITRGKMALNKVLPTKHSCGTNDIIGKALQLGAQVISIEDFTRYYMRKSNKEKESKKPLKMLCSSRLKKGTTDTQVIRLKEVFFKFEDKSRCFRPLIYQMKQWPKIYYNTCLFQCPFELPKPNKLDVLEKLEKETLTEELESDMKVGREEHSNTKEVEKYRSKKCGYCDCCNLRYTDLLKHLQGQTHRKFVDNNMNFGSLDKLIAGGTSFKDFLALTKRKTRTVLKDKINSVQEVDFNFHKTSSTINNIYENSHPKKRLVFEKIAANLNVEHSISLENTFQSNASPIREKIESHVQKCSLCRALNSDSTICTFVDNLIGESNNLQTKSKECEETTSRCIHDPDISLLNVGECLKEGKSIRLKEELSEIYEKENFNGSYSGSEVHQSDIGDLLMTPHQSIPPTTVKKTILQNPSHVKVLQICNNEPCGKSAALEKSYQFDEEINQSKIFRRLRRRLGKSFRTQSSYISQNQSDDESEFLEILNDELSENFSHCNGGLIQRNFYSNSNRLESKFSLVNKDSSVKSTPPSDCLVSPRSNNNRNNSKRLLNVYTDSFNYSIDLSTELDRNVLYQNQASKRCSAFVSPVDNLQPFSRNTDKLNDTKALYPETFLSISDELSENTAALTKTSVRSSDCEVLTEKHVTLSSRLDTAAAALLKPPEVCLGTYEQSFRHDEDDHPKKHFKASKSFAKVIFVRDFQEVSEDAKFFLPSNNEKQELRILKKRIASPDNFVRLRKRSRTTPSNFKV